MSLTDGVNRFFFDPAPARPLGVCRAFFYLLLLLTYGSVDYGAFGNFPASFRNPIWIFQLLHLSIVSSRLLSVLGWIFKLSLLASAIGLVTRFSTLVAAVVGSYVLAVPNCFGRAGHGDDAILIVLWLLALSRCGDAVSMDSIRKQPPQPSGEYRWPIRMVWLLMAMVYFAAGVTKLRISGLHWAFSDNMVFTLRAHEVNNSNPLLHLGPWIADHAWMARTLAAATLVLETCFVFTLFSKWARRSFVPGMFLGHMFIALVMGVVFWQFMFTYIFWLPWDWILRRMRST